VKRYSSGMYVRLAFAVAAHLEAERRLGVLVMVLAGLGASAWLAREPLLRGAADLWIVSDEVTQADVVAVLGGEIDVRPISITEDLSKKVLVSNNAENRAAVIGAFQGHTAARPNVSISGLT
jgi:hypothetical protein